MKRKIDFLIIGAQKSATTTMYDWLRQHPDIYLPEEKENVFFAKDDCYQQGYKYLDIFYEGYKGQKVVGGTHAHLMYFSSSAERIYQYNQNMKIIAVLRNPVDRAYSAYWYARRIGCENIKTFEDALEKEVERAKGTFKERAELTYVKHGHYAEQLKIYLDLFGNENVIIMFTDEIKNEPLACIEKVLNILDLGRSTKDIDIRSKSNQSSLPRLMLLQQVLLASDAWYKIILRKFVTQRVRLFIRVRIIGNIVKFNEKPFQYSPMRNETRKKLVDYFRPYNDQLEKLTGRDLSSWNT